MQLVTTRDKLDFSQDYGWLLETRPDRSDLPKISLLPLSR
jgi:hypothetical protein